jgi:uncharacterized protein YjdB
MASQIRGSRAFRWIPNAPSRVLGLGLASALVLLSCKGDALDPDGGAVASVVVVPNRVIVGVGASTPLTAELRDAGGAVLTGRKVAWASKDPAVATVSSAGVVTGITAGPVQVAATAEGKSAVVDVTVNPKAVSTVRVTPVGDVGLLVGGTRQMAAQPLDAEGGMLTDRPVTWTSNAAAVATVSTTGLITAVAPGGAVISATSEGKSSVVAVTVSSVPVASVAVTPPNDDVVVSQTLQLAAVAKNEQGGTLTGRPVSWSTSDATRATVSSTGLVTGVAPGSVTITASVEGKTGSSAITVKPKPVGAVIVSPAQVSVEVGATRQLTAQVTDDQGNVLTGRPVAYTSDAPTIATVSTAGLVTAVAIGTAKITATSEGKTGTADISVVAVPVASVDVSPPQSSLTVGQQGALVATPRDAQGGLLSGRPVAWTSGAPSVATVSANGTVTAVGAGTAVIFATVEGRTGSANVTVRQIAVTGVTVAPASSNIAVGAFVQLAATVRSGTTVLTDRVVGWSSSNETIAVVSSGGRVTGLKAGVVTITATSEGVTGTAVVAVGISSVAVTPSPTSVTVGATRQLTAVARDASNAVVAGVTFQWTSAAPQTATVSASGLVTGVAPGVSSVSASVGTVSGSSAVTVTAAPVATVTVAPPTASVARGKTVQLTATLRDANGNVLTGRAITWSSSAPLVATVNSSSGLVTASTLLTGNTTITALSEGKTGTATVTVTPQ